MKIQKNTFIYAILTLALLAFALAFLPFAPTIIVAMIFALGISYWLDNLYIKFPRTKRRLVMLSIFLGIFILIGTTFSASNRIYNLTMGDDREETFNSLKEAKTKLLATIETQRQNLAGFGVKVPPIREEALVRDWTKFAQSNVGTTITRMGGYLTTLTDVVVNILVFSVFVTVMVKRRHSILEGLSDTSLWGDLRLRSIFIKAQEASYGSVFTIFTVGLVQTIIMTVGAGFAGFEELSIIFIATFFASFFPVLGTAPIGVALAAIAFFQGDTTPGVIMLCIAAFVGVVDNWLKPYLVAHSGPQMNGLITLVGIVGAVMIFGLPGLFVGPFLMIFIPSLKSEAADLLRSLTRAHKAKVPALVTDVNDPHEAPHFN